MYNVSSYKTKSEQMGERGCVAVAVFAASLTSVKTDIFTPLRSMCVIVHCLLRYNLLFSLRENVSSHYTEVKNGEST